jgi:hypothetical protein
MSVNEREFEDVGEPDFQDAFVRIAGLEHRITTQAAYWINSLGGGGKYHGAGYRLSFHCDIHHAHNADQVMNSVMCWVYHMTKTLKEYYPISG